jgi:hypothetical protein
VSIGGGGYGSRLDVSGGRDVTRVSSMAGFTSEVSALYTVVIDGTVYERQRTISSGLLTSRGHEYRRGRYSL